ncbi:hypothetical protein VitviT2T_018677 [Vitis vinifera]|uniref:Uncharacterized protein n=2 Tax=Vitis vinifera TaxID=29760 RepID=A0ABY9CYU4_VITVI|nr:hypothetical protein VitviT2T_018677 [Vitis vinifera]
MAELLEWMVPATPTVAKATAIAGIERMIPWVMVVTANTCHQEAAETEQKHEPLHCNDISHGLHILELSKFSLQSPNTPY